MKPTIQTAPRPARLRRAARSRAARVPAALLPAALLPAALGLAALLAAACGSGAGAVRPDTDPHRPDRLYPLAEENVWTYDVDDGSGENVFHFLRVLSADGDRREVAAPSGDTEVYELGPQGIRATAHDSWLLRAPIRQGAEWPARSGRTARVVSVDRSVETPAGAFERCVEIEEQGGDTGQQVTTIYCPDVGPVVIRTQLPMDLSPQPVVLVARLRAYQVE